MTTEKKPKKILKGVVVAKSGDKTIKVRIESRRLHPLYQKRVPRTRHYLVHDPANTAVVGDTVAFVSTRPLSAHKRWKLVKEV